jgi:hypothetical protein
VPTTRRRPISDVIAGSVVEARGHSLEPLIRADVVPDQRAHHSGRHFSPRAARTTRETLAVSSARLTPWLDPSASSRSWLARPTASSRLRASPRPHGFPYRTEPARDHVRPLPTQQARPVPSATGSPGPGGARPYVAVGPPAPIGRGPRATPGRLTVRLRDFDALRDDVFSRLDTSGEIVALGGEAAGSAAQSVSTTTFTSFRKVYSWAMTSKRSPSASAR